MTQIQNYFKFDVVEFKYLVQIAKKNRPYKRNKTSFLTKNINYIITKN